MTNQQLIEKLEYCAEYNDLGAGMAELVTIAADRIKYLSKFVEWRPIEEAPKEDTFVHSYSKRHGTEISFCGESLPGNNTFRNYQTHWLPLPPKPEDRP
jgi:hypothetical protein